MKLKLFPDLFIAAFGAAFFVLPVPLQKEIFAPVPVAEAAQPSAFPLAQFAAPSRIRIPSIKLDSPVSAMGINDIGQLDVPSGKSNTVGWYAGGTTPGEVGSAVLDAHVFAALKNLHNAKVGGDIYVSMSNGALLHFKITQKKTVPLSKVDDEELFNDASGRTLHLITCAGTYDSKAKTYTARLLVYAQLVE
ncbi:MAG TPA: class F sortase [Candidatus Paceibacterota bacterium]|nr:class F sortase [Candidatus Paceibacterota bacterium]